ncbi:hypothetical protein [Myroides sp. NP-2]|uniref:hypothetical protein n=1 Tax=Myroides sp. NP-2 TaxID=2759945 RepID=UPI0015F9A6A2|nr:hypothetical protein [Myroides sp. NP-2]
MSDKISKNPYCLPNYLPQKSIGKQLNKISFKIFIKKDYTRADGTNALYIQLILDRVIKRIPLTIFVPIKDFDKVEPYTRNEL